MTPAPRCPHKHYRTANLAERAAWWRETNPAKRPTPVRCECGTGAWRLAARDEQPEARNR